MNPSRQQTLTNREMQIMIKLNPETAELIVSAFDDYALWSNMSKDESNQNQRYAICRQAKAIMVLVDLGMDHCLQDWADEVLSDDSYTKAGYTS
jgi:hypothetical protein